MAPWPGPATAGVAGQPSPAVSPRPSHRVYDHCRGQYRRRRIRPRCVDFHRRVRFWLRQFACRHERPGGERRVGESAVHHRRGAHGNRSRPWVPMAGAAGRGLGACTTACDAGSGLGKAARYRRRRGGDRRPRAWRVNLHRRCRPPAESQGVQPLSGAVPAAPSPASARALPPSGSPAASADCPPARTPPGGERRVGELAHRPPPAAPQRESTSRSWAPVALWPGPRAAVSVRAPPPGTPARVLGKSRAGTGGAVAGTGSRGRGGSAFTGGATSGRVTWRPTAVGGSTGGAASGLGARTSTVGFACGLGRSPAGISAARGRTIGSGSRRIHHHP